MTRSEWNRKLTELCETMAGAIKAATGHRDAVTVVCRAAGHWTVHGPDEAVQASRPVLTEVPLILVSSHYDRTPDADGDVDTDRYDYWREP